MIASYAYYGGASLSAATNPLTLEEKEIRERQSRIARDRDHRSLRIEVIENGVLVTERDSGANYSYFDDKDLHAHIDRFLQRKRCEIRHRR